MDKAGVRTGGYRTTWLVGAYDFRRDLDPRFAQLVQASIGHIYQDFTTRAAAARSTTREAIDAVAQGRIWTGEQARGHGLIDRTGTLADAIRAARERAKLPEDAGIRYVTGEKDNVRFGITLRNVGPPIRYRGDGLSLDATVSTGSGNTTTLNMDQRSEKFELPSMVMLVLPTTLISANALSSQPTFSLHQTRLPATSLLLVLSMLLTIVSS
jgi:ClpP class serine protease